MMLNPPLGGQRQAYTHVATDVASHGYVVLTIDHPLLSGVVEVGEKHMVFNVAREIIQLREAIFTYIFDMAAVFTHIVGVTGRLSSFSEILGVKLNLNDTCVYGHGLGARVAEAMVAHGIVTCGGPLRGGMPAPYTEKDVYPIANTTPTRKHVGNHTVSDDLQDDAAGNLSDGLKNMAMGMGRTALDALSSMVCRILDTCGTATHKRGQTEYSWE